MWFFMITCYIMSALSFFMLILALFQNLFHFMIFHANEVTFMILTSIVYLFTETLVIFFFVGTGVSIKEYTAEHKLKPDYHKNSLAIKRFVYPPLLLNMLLMIILFILIGAADTGLFPAWIYLIYFLFCIYHFLLAKGIQHRAFKNNTDNILAMAGVQKNA